MKKIKVSLAAVAFVLGIAGAFAFKPVETSSGNNQPLFWFNEDGTAYQHSGLMTIDQRQPVSGCSGSQQDCERGYLPEQLIDSEDPDQGVIPTEINSPSGLLQKN